MEDKLILGGKSFDSRFILGSGKYDPNLIKACVESAGCEMITVALRRANTDDTKNILNFIPENVTIIPNTSGREMQTKLLELQDLLVKWAAAIS